MTPSDVRHEAIAGEPVDSHPAPAGIPVLLEVAHELRAQVTGGLLARVQRHVLPVQLERLLADPDRAAVRDRVDKPGVRQRLDPRLQRGFKLVGRDDLVAQQAASGSPATHSRPDRIACRAARSPTNRGSLRLEAPG